jgi:fluoride exporter
MGDGEVMTWIVLALGGIAGTISRYAMAGMVYRVVGTQFPYGTLAVNLLGCFLIGLLDVLAQEKFVLSPQARLFLMVGFCGAFTTFSTFILETGNLIKDGQSVLAFANLMVSVALGFVVYRAGILLGRLIN